MLLLPVREGKRPSTKKQTVMKTKHCANALPSQHWRRTTLSRATPQVFGDEEIESQASGSERLLGRDGASAGI